MTTTQEIAEDLVALCRQGKFEESGEKYWADDVVSLEAGEGDMARVVGKDGVRGKGEWWAANHEVHGVVVEGRSAVGVTAGASAPELLVQQVVERLRSWGGSVPREILGREENVVFSLPRALRPSAGG